MLAGIMAGTGWGSMGGIKKKKKKSHWNPADYVALPSFSLSLSLLITLQQTLWLAGTLQLSCCPIQDHEIVKKLQREWWNKYVSIWSTTALTWQLLLSRFLFVLLATNIKEASWKLKATERDFAQLGRSPWQTQSQGNRTAVVTQKPGWHKSFAASWAPLIPLLWCFKSAPLPVQNGDKSATVSLWCVEPTPWAHLFIKEIKDCVIYHYCSAYTTFRTLDLFVYSATYDYVIALTRGGGELEHGEKNKEAELRLFSQCLLDRNSLSFNSHLSKQS